MSEVFILFFLSWKKNNPITKQIAELPVLLSEGSKRELIKNRKMHRSALRSSVEIRV